MNCLKSQKNHLIYHKDNIFKNFLRNYKRFSFLKKNKQFFSQRLIINSLESEKDKSRK